MTLTLRALICCSIFAISCSAMNASAADKKANYFGSDKLMEYGSWWYIRGDVSVANYQGPDVYCGCIQQSTISHEMGMAGSVGLGYHINRYFRVEASAEYRSPTEITFKSSDDSDGTARYNSAAGFLNAYVDIPLAKKITPYFGLGVGISQNTINGVSLENLPCGSCSPSEWEGDSTVSLAFSAMAGVAYELNPNTQLDFGYRFIKLGNAHSSTQTNLSANSPRYEFKDLTSHDVRLGVRYLID